MGYYGKTIYVSWNIGFLEMDTTKRKVGRPRGGKSHPALREYWRRQAVKQKARREAQKEEGE